MIIDNFYENIEKNNFYLGVISQVYKDNCVVQVENLTWLEKRRINDEVIAANGINFSVIIDSLYGLFIGDVIYSKIVGPENNNHVMYNDEKTKNIAELNIQLNGLLKSNGLFFERSGFLSPGLTDNVYIANIKILKKYIDSLEPVRLDNNYLSKKLPSFATIVNLQNQELTISPETIFDRHLIAIGTTNSGKSTSALSIINTLINEDKKILFIDPTGEYSAAFEEEKFKKLNLGKDSILDTGKVNFTQWATLFETNDSTQPAVLADAIKSLRFQYKNNCSLEYVKSGKKITDVLSDMNSLTDQDLSFELSLLPNQIVEEAVESDKNMIKYTSNSFQFNNKQWLVQKVNHKLKNVNLIEFFKNDDNKIDLLFEIDRFLNEEIQSLYINTSSIGISNGIGSMIIDIICEYVMDKKNERKRGFVLFVDEVHRYSKDYKNNGYQTGLTFIAREGRKNGIFLFLTTQNPNDIPDELLGQIGTLLIHRLTHKKELDSIRNYLSENTFKEISKLNQGEAVLTSINLSKDLFLKMKKCNRVHLNRTKNL